LVGTPLLFIDLRTKEMNSTVGRAFTSAGKRQKSLDLSAGAF